MPRRAHSKDTAMSRQSDQSVLVLNVDDHEPARYAKTRILRSGGLQVVEAASGEDALRMVAEKRPDLVLLDVKLPDMNGFEVCRRIKADPNIANTIVIQNSASFVGSDDKVRGLEGGADTYLTSPIEPSVLLATVKALLRLRRAERELAESRESYRVLISQICDYAIFQITLDGKMASWNGGVERVLGYNENEFVGIPIEAIFRKSDIEAGFAAKDLREAEEKGSSQGDRWMCRKGGEQFWAMSTTTAIRDSGGVVTGFMKVMRDQTELKTATTELARHRDELDALVVERTAELELSIRQLQLAERMASIGTLAAGLGHDMGNLLLPLRVRLELLSAMRLPVEAQVEIAAIGSLSQYLERLSSGLRLLAVDPMRAGPAVSVDTGVLLREAEPILRNALPRKMHLRIQSSTEQLWAKITSAALTQIVFNLVQNAGDAMRNQSDGAVSISTRAEGGQVVIEVADNGPGMTDEVARRCMEPFFSTKERSVSTGLGLALVYGLTAACGGKVEIQTALGKGARFSIRLPKGEPERSLDKSGRPIRVLVLVRDARVRAFVQTEIRALGCEFVDHRTDGPEPDVLVADHAEATGLSPDRTIYFLESGTTGGRYLGAKPKFVEIREALRNACAIQA